MFLFFSSYPDFVLQPALEEKNIWNIRGFLTNGFYPSGNTDGVSSRKCKTRARTKRGNKEKKRLQRFSGSSSLLSTSGLLNTLSTERYLKLLRSSLRNHERNLSTIILLERENLPTGEVIKSTQAKNKKQKKTTKVGRGNFARLFTVELDLSPT